MKPSLDDLGDFVTFKDFIAEWVDRNPHRVWQLAERFAITPHEAMVWSRGEHEPLLITQKLILQWLKEHP